MRIQNIFVGLVASFGICFAMQAGPIMFYGEVWNPSTVFPEREDVIRAGCLEIYLPQHTSDDRSSEGVAGHLDTPITEPLDVTEVDRSNAPSRSVVGFAALLRRCVGYSNTRITRRADDTSSQNN